MESTIAMTRDRWNLNRVALAILAPILVLSGVFGLVSPGHQGTSEAPAYDVFHIVFGVIGLRLLRSKNTTRIRAFNVGFGLIDLYQALASRLHLFPECLFRWTSTDDVVHVAIGIGLVLIGLTVGRVTSRS